MILCGMTELAVKRCDLEGTLMQWSIPECTETMWLDLDNMNGDLNLQSMPYPFYENDDLHFFILCGEGKDLFI